MGASASRAAAGRSASHAPAPPPPVPGATARHAIAEAERAASESADHAAAAAAAPAWVRPPPPPATPADAAAADAAASTAAELTAGVELGRLLAGAVRVRADPTGGVGGGPGHLPSSAPPRQRKKSAPAGLPPAGRLDARALADLLTAAAEGRDTARLAAGADPALVAAFLRSARAVAETQGAPPPRGKAEEEGAFDV